MKKLGLILFTFFFYSCHSSYYLPVADTAYQSINTKCGDIDIGLEGFLEQGSKGAIGFIYHVVLPEKSIHKIAPFNIEIAVEDSIVSDYQFYYDGWHSDAEMKDQFYEPKDNFLVYSFSLPKEKIDFKDFSIQADKFLVCNDGIYEIPKVVFINNKDVDWTKVASDTYPMFKRSK